MQVIQFPTELTTIVNGRTITRHCEPRFAITTGFDELDELFHLSDKSFNDNLGSDFCYSKVIIGHFACSLFQTYIKLTNTFDKFKIKLDDNALSNFNHHLNIGRLLINKNYTHEEEDLKIRFIIQTSFTVRTVLGVEIYVECRKTNLFLTSQFSVKSLYDKSRESVIKHIKDRMAKLDPNSILTIKVKSGLRVTRIPYVVGSNTSMNGTVYWSVNIDDKRVSFEDYGILIQKITDYVVTSIGSE